MRSMPALVFACYAAAFSAATLPFALAWMASAPIAATADAVGPAPMPQEAPTRTVAVDGATG
ncbi:MAG: hypothetical protein AAF577_00460 [Pseudomonadota bacterium]